MAKILAVIFAILFVILTAVILFLATLDARLFNPETYKQALQEQRLYQRLPMLVAEQLVHSMNYRPCAEDPGLCAGEEQGATAESGGPPIYFKNLTLGEWEDLLSELISPAWIQVQTERVIDQFFTYINSDQPSLSLTVSIIELKERLGGEEGLRAVMGLIRSQPPCTVAQLLTITDMILAGELKDIPICRPPDDILSDISPLARSALSQAALALPDEVNLAPTMRSGEANAPAPGAPGDFRLVLRKFRTGIHLSLLLPVVLILLVTLFGVRSFKGWLLWWGIPLIIAGLLLAIMAITATAAYSLGVASLMNSGRISTSGITPELFQVAEDIGASIIRSVVLRQIVQAGLVTFIGLVMLIISFFVKPKHEMPEL
jgi:hypothetical protein